MNWMTIANYVKNIKFLGENDIKVTIDGLHATVDIKGTKYQFADTEEFNGFVLGLRVGRNLK